MKEIGNKKDNNSNNSSSFRSSKDSLEPKVTNTPKPQEVGNPERLESLEKEENSHKNTLAKEKSYEEAITKIEELKKELLYLKAEFDNYKKQSIKERSNLIKYGGEGLAVALLDILDNFERASQIEVNMETLESFKQGVEMTASGLKSVLQSFGIEEVSSLHQPFNPSFHEAIGQEESSEVPTDHVTQVFRKPYKFHTKVIRPGQVVVAKESSSLEISISPEASPKDSSADASIDAGVDTDAKR